MCLIELSELYELFGSIIQSKVFRFAIIGGSLYLLSAALLFIFEKKMHMPVNKAYMLQTVITYTLQFMFNALWTWADPDASMLDNIFKVARFIPAKIIIWYINQWVFKGWKYAIKSTQSANAITVLTIMVFNYILFDRFVFKQAE